METGTQGSGRTAMTQQTKVVLVDDHPVIRDGLAFLLGEQPDFVVVGEAESA